ncbi:MAG TPA: NfeD family protein [Steroidobacteraceae bacterium]|jgi:membrane protein implicated in regulation of membrane protease activity
MNWWGWMIGGAILLGAELGFVNAQFYLVFIGSAAIIVGLLDATLGLAPEWQWALFALLAVLSMVMFRGPLSRRLHLRLPSMPSGPAGGVLTLPDALAPGHSCQVEHAGTFWTVRNEGATVIAPGASARIISVQGLTLLVRPDPQPQA